MGTTWTHGGDFGYHGSGYQNPGVQAMARKKEKEMPETSSEQEIMRIRLDLPLADYKRLERIARSKGLSKASFARMAVLAMIKAEEKEVPQR
jgi:hypothetical protein